VPFLSQDRAHLADRLITQSGSHQHPGQMHAQRHVIGRGLDCPAQAVEHRWLSFHTVTRYAKNRGH
jgi:hypothetical protein